jgi:cytochrome c oxidase assembly protein subunit 11
MPVLLVLDPGLEKDVHTVTLSYTFFQVDEQSQTTKAAGDGKHG